MPRPAIGGGYMLYLPTIGGGVQYMQSAGAGLLFLVRMHMVYSCNRECPPPPVIDQPTLGVGLF
jgi:hypothetical protein